MKTTLLPTRLMTGLLTIIFAFSFVIVSDAQTPREDAKKLKRPKDCGISDYDAFKNSSFSLMAEVLKTDLNYEKIKTDMNGYLSGDQKPTVDGIAADMKRLKSLLKSIKVMDDRVVNLTKDGNDLLKNAKNVKPVTKAKPATSNTKSSLKAVDVSKGLMKELTTSVTGDIDTLTEKMGELGGKDDEE